MTPPDDRDPVDVLAEEFADQLRRGEHPSVTDYAAKHPDHADALREVLPAVAQMEFLKRFRRATGLTDKGAVPERFGDFRIVGELGRGGMGVVFEAVQESLGRSVALKVLSTHAQLDNVRRERFVREAHAAARLHHTNIVPVFGVGTQDGLPYYAMQLIRGEGLNAVASRWRQQRQKPIDHDASTVAGHKTGQIRRPDGKRVPETAADDAPVYGDWAFVAETGAQVAEALHYAHKQGVLHRDVKPANLILDPEGRVWVTDFGLAKMAEQEGLTASGDILGTLQYLPPECLAGKADARSDVYGLGATLYELLTLAPPHPAENPARLVKLVAERDPTPPREINPDIPLDLETIVLKAMAREPAHRYASARELARDLEAFLDDRPIKARRQTWVGRGWRWCRRNPVVALLSVNTVAALLLAATVGWVAYVKTKRALKAEEDQLAEATRARAEAVQASDKLEANLRLCLAAFEDVFEKAGGRPLFGGPGFPGGFGRGPGGHGGGPFGEGGPKFGDGGPRDGGPKKDGPGMFQRGVDEKAAILESVLTFYDKFAEQNATNPRLQLEAARAHRRIGEVRSLDPATSRQGAASFRRAADLLERLYQGGNREEGVRTELAQTYLDTPLDALADPERLVQRALELCEGLETSPRPHLHASLVLKLGWARDKAGNRVGAETAYRDAIAEFGEVPDGPPTGLLPGPPGPVPNPAAGKALTRLSLAALLVATDRAAEARKLLEESIGEFRSVGDRFRFGGRYPWEVVSATYQQLADVCERLGDRPAAKAARDEANRTSGGPGGGGFGGSKKDGSRKN